MSDLTTEDSLNQTQPSLEYRAARARVSAAEALHALFNNGLTKSNLDLQRWVFALAKQREGDSQ